MNMEGSSSSAGANASSAKSHGEPNCSASSSSGTQLNPHASEWSLEENKSPEEMRTLYVTFSKQNPLSDSEIAWFFNHNYGRCVRKVIIFQGDQNNPPVSGIVIFRVASVPTAIMGKESNARFYVNGKSLWCKWYGSSGKESYEPREEGLMTRGRVSAYIPNN